MLLVSSSDALAPSLIASFHSSGFLLLIIDVVDEPELPSSPDAGATSIGASTSASSSGTSGASVGS